MIYMQSLCVFMGTQFLRPVSSPPHILTYFSAFEQHFPSYCSTSINFAREPLRRVPFLIGSSKKSKFSRDGWCDCVVRFSENLSPKGGESPVLVGNDVRDFPMFEFCVCPLLKDFTNIIFFQLILIRVYPKRDNMWLAMSVSL